MSPEHRPNPWGQPENPADGLISASEWRTLKRQYSLSDREATVAQMLFEGLNRQQIANQIVKEDGSSLSQETVRVYIDRLFDKLEVTTTAQMVLRVVRALKCPDL